MSKDDLYTRWLDIPPGKRPPDHYTLLGLPRFCRDKDIINRAVQTQLKRLDPYQIHRDRDTREACVQIRNEIAQAGVVLLDPKRRDAYERRFSSEGAAPAKPGEPASQGVPDGADETKDPWDDASTEAAETSDWVEAELERSDQVLDGPSEAEGLTPPEQPEAIADGRDMTVRSTRSSRLTAIVIVAVLVALSAFAFYHALWPSAGSKPIDDRSKAPEGQLRGSQESSQQRDNDTIPALCEVAVQHPDSDLGRRAQERLANLSDMDRLRELWTVVFDQKYSSLCPVLVAALQAKCAFLKDSSVAATGQSFRATDVETLMRGFRSILPPQNSGPVRRLLLDILRTECDGLSRDRAVSLFTDSFAGASGPEMTGLLRELLTGQGTICLRGNERVEPGDFVLTCLQSEKASPEFKAAVPGILAELWEVLDAHLEGPCRKPLATYALESLDAKAALEFAATWPVDVDFGRISDLMFESLVSDDDTLRSAARTAFQALLNHLAGESLTQWITRLRGSEDPRHHEISRMALAKADGTGLKDLIPSFFQSEDPNDRDAARSALPRTDPNHLADVIPPFLDSNEPADHMAARTAFSGVKDEPYLTRLIPLFLDSNEPVDRAVARTVFSSVKGEEHLALLIPHFLASNDPNDQQAGMDKLGGLSRTGRLAVLRDVSATYGHDIESQRRILNDANEPVRTDVAIVILECSQGSSREARDLRRRAFSIVAGSRIQDADALSAAGRYVRGLLAEQLASHLRLVADDGVHPDLAEIVVETMYERGESQTLFRLLADLPDEAVNVVLALIERTGEPPERREFIRLVSSLEAVVARAYRDEDVRIRAVKVLSGFDQDRENGLVLKRLNDAYKREKSKPESDQNERVLEELEKWRARLRKEPPDNPYLPRGRNQTPRTRRRGSR